MFDTSTSSFLTSLQPYFESVVMLFNGVTKEMAEFDVRQAVHSLQSAYEDVQTNVSVWVAQARAFLFAMYETYPHLAATLAVCVLVFSLLVFSAFLIIGHTRRSRSSTRVAQPTIPTVITKEEELTDQEKKETLNVVDDSDDEKDEKDKEEDEEGEEKSIVSPPRTRRGTRRTYTTTPKTISYTDQESKENVAPNVKVKATTNKKAARRKSTRNATKLTNVAPTKRRQSSRIQTRALRSLS